MSDFSGIIKNGLEKGWPLQEIQRSLLNAGYNPQEVQVEISKFVQQPMPVAIPQEDTQKLSNYQVQQVQTNKGSIKPFLFTSLILVILLILSLAGYLLFS